MKTHDIITLMAAAFLTAACTGNTDTVKLDNGLLELTFDSESGRLRSFVSKGQDGEGNVQMMDTGAAGAEKGLTWHLLDTNGTAVEDTAGMQFRIRRHGHDIASMDWKLADGVRVSVRVRLGSGEALSYWSVSVSGSAGKGITSIEFPVIDGFASRPDEKLAVSDWQGTLYSDIRSSITEQHPVRKLSWSLPSTLTMQLLALYSDSAPGLYISSTDTSAMSKIYSIILDSEHTSISQSTEFSEDSSRDTLTPGYEAVIGAFRGDWHEAAAIYRKWAVQQPWCRDSRFHNKLTTKWARNTAAWIWNRNSASNVIPEAEDLSEYIGDLPVSILWHWWHGCPYDDGFPDYIPPRDGAENFTAAIDDAASHGIHTMVYMNSIQWGRNTDSYQECGADRFKAVKRDGSDYSHVHNVFTGHALTPMCMATDFWHQKYASLCDTVINHYHVSGVYMDQACLTLRCYSPDHGHPVGGGNSWIRGFGELERMIRSRTGDPALAGEGSGEMWIPHLDLFLTLESSRERYMGVIENVRTIPLYQAVYHDYAITFGSYSSLVYPPYDDLWPDGYRPADRETELPEEFNLQFRMEQARGFVWGTQPMIANYHSFLRRTRPAELDYFRRLVRTRANAPEYLGCGVCARSPHIDTRDTLVPVSRISIYAGRRGDRVTRGEISSPIILSEGWKSASGGYAVAITNISDDEMPVCFDIDPSDYGIDGDYRVNIITSSGRRPCCDRRTGIMTFSGTIAGRDACIVEFVRM